MEVCQNIRKYAQDGHNLVTVCFGRWLIALITDFEAVDRIITHLKLRFIADRPPPSPVFEAVALMTAEESGDDE